MEAARKSSPPRPGQAGIVHIITWQTCCDAEYAFVGTSLLYLEDSLTSWKVLCASIAELSQLSLKVDCIARPSLCSESAIQWIVWLVCGQSPDTCIVTVASLRCETRSARSMWWGKRARGHHSLLKTMAKAAIMSVILNATVEFLGQEPSCRSSRLCTVSCRGLATSTN